MDKLPVVISIVSLSVAMLTLGWTIYRDAIRKPKFRVSVAIKSIHQAGRPTDGPHIFIEALNLGPLQNRLGMVFARKSWWQRRTQPENSSAFIYANFGHMATTPAGTRLEVGDTGTFVFPHDKDSFLKDDFVQVGVADGYGTIHWAPRAQLKKAREQYRKRFLEKKASG